jgi:sulfite dehydrogenase (quinone) subunit SoeC
MRPAFSVLLFTVLSGAGVGTLMWAALLDLIVFAGVVPSAAVLWPVVTGLLLTIAGLSASTLHLANPRNAWRSATRWRTSWLSREAVFALALVGCAFLYAWMLWAGSRSTRLVPALLTFLLAIATVYCTAMIYASLKPIPQWHTWRVPLVYGLLALASGALCMVVVGRFVDVGDLNGLRGVGVALFAVTAALKLEYWRFVDARGSGLTLERAIGVAQGVGPPTPPRGARPSVMAARLLDVGHSSGTFLTREFGYSSTRRTRMALRGLALVAGFALPAAWLAAGTRAWPTALAVSAACIIGLLAERWLFFAEAQHTVRLYHGQARV